MSTPQIDPTLQKLPPYGLMTDGLQRDLEKFPTVPPDFDRFGRTPSTCRHRSWDKLVQDTTEILARTLWPEYTGGGWTGPATATAVARLREDLALILDLQVSALIETPDSPLKAINCPNHETIYRAEDSGDFFSNYKSMDTSLSSDDIDLFSRVFDANAARKHGSSHLQFKVKFQRPRAFQAAFILNGPPIRPRQSISAGTPSIPSGHALESVLGIGAVIEYLLANHRGLSRESWLALLQLTVDIGDRRVFAGVHHPSDNLASWIIAMRMASHVFREIEVKAKLWEAISTRSRVFLEMAGRPVYADGLQALREAVGDVAHMVGV